MAATTASAVMPASRDSQQSSSLKRGAVNRSRSRQGVLTRSLEDLHASLLKAGARRGRISTLKVAPTTRENEQPTPPVTASSSGSSDCHHDFDLPVKCHQQSTRRRDDDAETPVCKVVLPGKHAVAPLSPKAKLPPAGGTTAVADKIGSVEVAEWVWSRDLQPLQKKSGGRQAGRYQRCKAAAVVAVATEKTGGDSSKIGKKLLLVDDLPWTFGSVCSTEAPTERTLSLGDDSSAPVTTQVVTSNSNRKGHRRSKLQVQGSALDAPFLTRLSDMSLRFPDPPTRPPPPATAASSSSRTVTISGWGKSVTSGMPSLQLLLPSTWRKGVAGNRRRRNKTARWVARSKATNSIAESSSFQSSRIFRSNQPLRRPKDAPRPDPDAHESSDRGDEAGHLLMSSENLTSLAADETPLPPPPEGLAPSPPRPTGDDKECRSLADRNDGKAAPSQQQSAFSAGIQSEDPPGTDGAAALSAGCAQSPAPAPAVAPTPDPDPAVDSLTSWVWRGAPVSGPRQKAGNRRRLTVAQDHGQGAADVRRETETPAGRFVVPRTPRAPARAPRKKLLGQ